jgi:diguanylate cyclase (GGDEF)-like protein/PAS domain S-box-containing protein
VSSLRQYLPGSKNPLQEGNIPESLRRIERAMRRATVEVSSAPEHCGQFEDLLANGPVGLYRVSTSGELLMGNPALARMLGFKSLEELMAERDAGPFSDASRLRVWQRLENELEIDHYESEWTTPSGRQVYLREHARAVMNGTGEVVCYEGALEDISDRRMAERQLQAERDFSSAVIDTAGSMVLILDPRGRVLRFNKACETVFGYALHDIAGFHFWDVFVPEEGYSAARESFRRVATGEFPRRHEGNWRTKSGQLRLIEWSDSAIVDIRGQIRFVISTGIDLTERKIAEDALVESESRYRELFETASDIVFRAGLDLEILSVNQAAEEITGYNRSDIRYLSEVLDPQVAEMAREKVRAQIEGRKETRFEIPVRHADGGTVLLDLSCTVRYENGMPVELLGIGRDISWRKRAEEFERGRRQILEMAARQEPLDAVMLKLAELLEAQFPKARCAVQLGSPLTVCAGHGRLSPGSPCYCELPAEDAEYRNGFRARWRLPVIAADERVLAQFTLLLPRTESPTPLESDVLATAVKLAALTIEHRLMTERIQWAAQHDRLTGLPNRHLFEEKLRRAIARHKRDHRRLGVFVVDLDRFKLINDTLGHAVGDVLLKSVGARLSETIDGRGVVARMSADEFIILVRDLEDAPALAKELLGCFDTAFKADGHELFAGASIGCSVYPDDGEDVQTLRKHADLAMYGAKASGRHRFLRFSPSMTTGMERRLSIQNGLHRALERNEFCIHYQPQYDLKDNRMIGVEALLRWTSPDLDMVSPSEFIVVAEETGMIMPIGAWVLREACRQGKIWQVAGYPVKVAVNVSALQFARAGFVETVEQALSDTGLPAHLLELELTETVVIQKPEEVREDLMRLRELGVLVAIDDFGMGYSSLSYLPNLPIQSLKIDRSFVQTISKAGEVPPLIRAITALARGLNMRVLAEGVEEDYQARVLRKAGCDLVQGYLYGGPAPVDEVTRLLARGCRASQD